ncbi:hypothetical protein, partial [Aureimonas jatrophae]|uniref:hypothetical protein n=1 Tax=Aureimonas jatrophae TaxID=1166073 RepID=UPI001AECC613
SSGLCFFCPIWASSIGSKAYFREDHFSGGRPWRLSLRDENERKYLNIIRQNTAVQSLLNKGNFSLDLNYLNNRLLDSNLSSFPTLTYSGDATD